MPYTVTHYDKSLPYKSRPISCKAKQLDLANQTSVNAAHKITYGTRHMTI